MGFFIQILLNLLLDECCNSLTVASNGQAGVLQAEVMGSYVYHQTAANGRKVFLGPSNSYLYSYQVLSGNSSGYTFWIVS